MSEKMDFIRKAFEMFSQNWEPIAIKMGKMLSGQFTYSWYSGKCENGKTMKPEERAVLDAYNKDVEKFFCEKVTGAYRNYIIFNGAAKFEISLKDPEFKKELDAIDAKHPKADAIGRKYIVRKGNHYPMEGKGVTECQFYQESDENGESVIRSFYENGGNWELKFPENKKGGYPAKRFDVVVKMDWDSIKTQTNNDKYYAYVYSHGSGSGPIEKNKDSGMVRGRGGDMAG